MINPSRRALGAMLLLGGLAACADTPPPAPPAPPPAPVVVGEVKEMRGRVESVDRTAREILVRFGTRLTTVVAGPGVQNLNEIRSGDNILVRYQSAVAARIAPAGSADPSGAAVATARERGRPEAAAGDLLVARVTFQSWNARTNTATVVTERGRTVELNVQDPQMRQFASRLRRGQRVDIGYSEAIAVAVTPMTPAQRAAARRG